MIQLLLVNECLDRDQSLGADRRRVARRLILALLFTAVALLTVVAGRAEPSAARTDESQLSRSVKVSRPGERPLRSVCAKRMDAPRTLRTSGLAIPTSFAHHQLLRTEATSSWLARVHIPDRLPSAPGTLSFAERRRPSVGRWHYDPASARMTGVEFVATKTGSRGLSNLGGIIEETGTNAAGGRIFTSTGAINQNDFAGLVESSLMRGDKVSILTGAHGAPNGSLLADASMLADDVAAFGKMPGVSVHNVASMSPAEISAVLKRPGTIIGGFCESGACLSPYRGG